jgi:Cu(I)/Ag(I) efflux system membrane fusion protein
MRAQPGDVLFRIADHSVVWALIDVAERDLGDLASVSRPPCGPRAFPAASSPGKVA